MRDSPPDFLYIGFMLGQGGDAVQMLELAAGMAGKGARVQLVVPELETSIKFAEQCRERGLPVVRTPWIQCSLEGVPQKPLDMLRLFKRYRAPLVHIHTGDCALPRTAILAMRLLMKPRVLVTVQAPNENITPGEPRALAWANSVKKQVHAVLCPSEHSRRYQMQMGVPAERSRVVRNSVDVKRFGNGNKQVALDELKIDAETPLVVFSSRLDDQKRPVDAVTVFGRIASEFPRAQMAILGRGALEGEMREAVRKLGLESRVHFVGQKENVHDWLAAATVWLFPTERENFSLALLEAMAARTAIVSTNCPGNDEVLVDGENALVSNVGDIDNMANGLRRLLADPALRARLAANAGSKAQQYSSERMVDAYAEAYAAFGYQLPFSRT